MKISPANKIKNDYSSPSHSRVGRRSKNLSSEFKFSSEKEKKENLQKLLSKIHKKGKQIISSMSIRAVNEYKRMIQEYLSIILYQGFYVKKVNSPWHGMDSLSIVAVLDKEIEALSNLLLTEEKETLSIINKVDCINGILLDTYQ